MKDRTSPPLGKTNHARTCDTHRPSVVRSIGAWTSMVFLHKGGWWFPDPYILFGSVLCCELILAVLPHLRPAFRLCDQNTHINPP